MGPGLLESIYERCLLRELTLRAIPAASQRIVVINYKNEQFEETRKFDVLVDDCLLVELKAVQDIRPIHKAQLPCYMRPLGVPSELLFRFHEITLVDGMSRLVLAGASSLST